MLKSAVVLGAIMFGGANAISLSGEPEGQNMTPYVRQLGNMWQGVVPNYEWTEGSDAPQSYTNLFAAEGEAKAWVYGKTGAEEPLMYETPAGADDSQDSIIKTVVKEGESANNSNYENENDQTEYDKPVIDADLAHTANQSYHDTYDHMSTIKGAGREHGGESKAVKRAKQAAWKAKRAAEKSKATSGAAQKHGVNSGLDDEAEAKTQGARDAADKKSQEWNSQFKGKKKMAAKYVAVDKQKKNDPSLKKTQQV
jgi:hypothetical protein